MSSAKDIISNRGSQPSWWKWFQQTSLNYIAVGMDWGRWAYMSSRYIGWFIVTTGMITALPLVFEIRRETAVEEIERLQINAALAEGRTPAELAQSGLSSAVEPKVLK